MFSLDSMLVGSTTATTASTPQSSSSAELLDAMQQVLQQAQPEPIGEWMRQVGFDPTCWTLVLPVALRDKVEGPVFWPTYVVFSPLVTAPVFLARWGSAPF